MAAKIYYLFISITWYHWKTKWRNDEMLKINVLKNIGPELKSNTFLSVGRKVEFSLFSLSFYMMPCSQFLKMVHLPCLVCGGNTTLVRCLNCGMVLRFIKFKTGWLKETNSYSKHKSQGALHPWTGIAKLQQLHHDWHVVFGGPPPLPTAPFMECKPL